MRFKIGDTVVTPVESALLSDEEITALLMSHGNSVYAASLACVRSLIARFSRLVTTSVGDTSVQWGELAAQYRELEKTLVRDMALNGGALPFAGGITRSGKETQEADADRVEPAFRREGVGTTGRRFTRDAFGEYS